MRARTDPGVVVVMKALLGLWRTEEVMFNSDVHTWSIGRRTSTSQLAMVT